jgi:hypothetical protein
MWLALVAVVVGVSIFGIAVSVRRVREDQVRRGLFGEPAREGLIGSWVAAVVELAERQVRLAYFGGALRARVWEGTTAEITRPPASGTTTWRFASGEVWQLDLTKATPRWARRVVVQSVDQHGPNLDLRVYVPGGQDLVLSVRDARSAG